MKISNCSSRFDLLPVPAERTLRRPMRQRRGTHCRTATRRPCHTNVHRPFHGRPPKRVDQLILASRHYTRAATCHRLLIKLPAQEPALREPVTRLYHHSLAEANAALKRFQDWTWEGKLDFRAFLRLLNLLPKVCLLAHEIRTHAAQTSDAASPPASQTHPAHQQIPTQPSPVQDLSEFFRLSREAA